MQGVPRADGELWTPQWDHPRYCRRAQWAKIQGPRSLHLSCSLPSFTQHPLGPGTQSIWTSVFSYVNERFYQRHFQLHQPKFLRIHAANVTPTHPTVLLPSKLIISTIFTPNDGDYFQFNRNCKNAWDVQLLSRKGINLIISDDLILKFYLRLNLCG